MVGKTINWNWLFQIPINWNWLFQIPINWNWLFQITINWNWSFQIPNNWNWIHDRKNQLIDWMQNNWFQSIISKPCLCQYPAFASQYWIYTSSLLLRLLQLSLYPNIEIGPVLGLEIRYQLASPWFFYFSLLNVNVISFVQPITVISVVRILENDQVLDCETKY